MMGAKYSLAQHLRNKEREATSWQNQADKDARQVHKDVILKKIAKHGIEHDEVKKRIKITSDKYGQEFVDKVLKGHVK